MIPENTDLNKYRCPLCGAPIQWWWSIKGNGVHCTDKCEKPTDPMQGYTVWDDLNDLKLKGE